MGFLTSTAPDITEGLPFGFTSRGRTNDAIRSGFIYDYLLNGVGFMKAAGQGADVVYRRVSMPLQKDQFDTSKEPGEQTLGGQWLRSQVTWHRGGGLTYYEPGSDDTTQYRYADSQGVNVWDEGHLTLLKDTDLQFVTAGSELCYATPAVLPGDIDVLFLNHNGDVKRWNGTATTDYTMGIVEASTPITVTGEKLLFGAQGGIYAGDIIGDTIAVLWSNVASEIPVPYWCKSRIFATRANSIFELTLAGGALAAETPLFTHPVDTWAWTSVTDGPTGVYAAGNAGGVGAIYKFALEDAAAGSTPKMGQAYQVAELPMGEQIHAIRSYLGTYLGIGTSRGLRIGVLDGQGRVQVGPLLVKTTYPVQALGATGSYLLAGVRAGMPDGTTGALKVFLGETIGDSLQFPWAWDAGTAAGVTGAAQSVATLGDSDRVAVSTTGAGVFVQSATLLVASGWVRTGRIRYGTSEPKMVRTVDVNAALPGGALRVESAVAGFDGDVFLATLTPETGPRRGIGVYGTETGVDWVQFKFTLTPDEDEILAPDLLGVQVKALPAPARMRRILLPLAVCDVDRDQAGSQWGGPGNGWERLMALEELEDAGAVVTVKDTITGDSFTAQIEQADFTWTSQVTGNMGGRERAPMAGYVNVICRKL